MNKKRKLLYFVAEDWYFWSHRRLLAEAAKRENYEIFVLTRVTDHGDKIKKLGFNLVPLNMERHGKNIYRELLLLAEIIKCYKKIKPEIAHHISIKPVLYGKIAAFITGVDKSVNTFPGLGYVYQSNKISDKLIGLFIKSILKYLFRIDKNKIIVQNEDDASFFHKERICNKSDLITIKGSGVNLKEFRSNGHTESQSIILFASRLLMQKGIIDFMEAAKIVKESKPGLRFVIVGKPDKSNPNSVPLSTLEEWQNRGHIEWWGYKEDMPEILKQAKLIVLPTFYGEGVPKILIEAAASGKPIIATNVPGCREIVKNNINGYLVPIHAPEVIAGHIVDLIDDAELCHRMGLESRRMAEEEFAISKVNRETLAVYATLFEATV